MKTREYYASGTETREAIVRVAEVLGTTVGATLGPGGRNYLTPFGVTNDGRTIINEMKFADTREQLIADIIKVVPERTDNDAGDGSTTSVVLATEIIKHTLPKVSDINFPSKPVLELTRQLEAEKDKVIAFLETKKRDIQSVEDLEKVAVTSMEDVEIAKLLAHTVYEGGKDSSIILEEGFTGKVETEVISGIKTQFGIAFGNKEVVLKDVPVVVAMHVFEAYREIAPLMGSLVESAKQSKITGLVVVGKQFSADFVKEVVQTSVASNFPILLVSNPQIEKSYFEDVAAYCGAKLIDTHPKGGVKISSLTYKDAGWLEKVVANPKDSLFIGGRGTKLADSETTSVQARVMELRQQLEKEKVSGTRETIERRIGQLLGGIVQVRVDAKTATEKFYRKLKVEDTLNSCQNALKGGMLTGGGVSLDEAADKLGEDALLYGALKAPRALIRRNYGGDVATEGVEDAYLVVKAGLENAVSVVKTLLTTEGVMAEADPTAIEQLKGELK